MKCQLSSATNPISWTNERAAAPWSSLYNGGTRQWLYESPAGRQRLEQLDSLGRVTSIAYPGTTSLPTTSYVYDADGRIQTVTLTANGGAATRVTQMTYDQYLAGYLATTEDPVGNVTTYDQRDQDGRVLDVELPDFAATPASHVSTTYDPNGNRSSVTVPSTSSTAPLPLATCSLVRTASVQECANRAAVPCGFATQAKRAGVHWRLIQVSKRASKRGAALLALESFL